MGFIDKLLMNSMEGFFCASPAGAALPELAGFKVLQLTARKSITDRKKRFFIFIHLRYWAQIANITNIHKIYCGKNVIISERLLLQFVC